MLLGGVVWLVAEDEGGSVTVVVRCEGKSVGVGVRAGIVVSVGLWFWVGWSVRYIL